MRFIFIGFMALLGAALACAFVEVALRVFGVSPGPYPAPYAPERFAHKPPYTSNDETGWQLNPGHYNLYSPVRGRTIEISVDDRGCRRTTMQPSSDKVSLLFIGDSFVFGENLDDSETLPWQVQLRRPKETVANFAVGGFGTCQSFLRLRQIAPSLQLRGGRVLYGLSEFHEERNSVDPRLDYWAALSSPRHTSLYPFCNIEQGTIRALPSKTWQPLLPLTGTLALSRVLSDSALSIYAQSAISIQRGITEQLLSALNEESTKYGATFTVMLQDITGAARTQYQDYLRTQGIQTIDLTEATAREDLRLKDGHPNPDMAQIWATQVAAEID